MCEYCDLKSDDPEKRRRAEESASASISLVDSVAEDYRKMKSGRIKPHTAEMVAVSSRARLLIRQLVIEYL